MEESVARKDLQNFKITKVRLLSQRFPSQVLQSYLPATSLLQHTRLAPYPASAELNAGEGIQLFDSGVLEQGSI